ncbi:hypothetical protein M569_05010, partial [Genlisea aurea]
NVEIWPRACCFLRDSRRVSPLITLSIHSVWRGVQGVGAQINGVLATQEWGSIVGLGKGAIPTAAAVNWVREDESWAELVTFYFVI